VLYKKELWERYGLQPLQGEEPLVGSLDRLGRRKTRHGFIGPKLHRPRLFSHYAIIKQLIFQWRDTRRLFPFLLFPFSY
jgi:hypothetical protein